MRSTRHVKVGVTGPDRGGYAAWCFTRLAVRLQGATAVRITPARKHDIEDLGALVIGGGADVSPETYTVEGEIDAIKASSREYGEKNLLIWLFYPLIYIIRRVFSTRNPLRYDNARDDLELELLNQAIDKKLPVLGICRGAQLLNIHLGGTLHQDLDDYYREQPQPRSVFPAKSIRIEPESRLKALMGIAECRVNALHRQAIKGIGNGLKVAATEDNGVIQAVEHESCLYMIGVQWHPEYLPHIMVHRKLFCGLVGAARAVKQ